MTDFSDIHEAVERRDNQIRCGYLMLNGDGTKYIENPNYTHKTKTVYKVSVVLVEYSERTGKRFEYDHSKIYDELHNAEDKAYCWVVVNNWPIDDIVIEEVSVPEYEPTEDQAMRWVFHRDRGEEYNNVNRPRKNRWEELKKQRARELGGGE